MAEKQFLTKKGYDERVARLEELKVVRRKEVAQKLKEAREQGDLSENAEYDAAKDEQRDIETEIAELEAILANCEVIQDNDKNKDVVKMESVVVLHDVEFDEDIEYTIVGSSEADSLNNKISNESPLGAALIGNYHGTSSEYITVLEGIREEAGDDVRILYSQGCDLYKDKVENLAWDQDRISEAVITAENSDVVILCVGLDETLEGEEGDTGNSDASGDKVDLHLPKVQEELIEKVTAVGKPTIVVLMAGSAIDLNYAQDNCNGILLAWYPGARGGRAIADLLFGKESPSGKLPITFYKDLEGMPEFTDYSMKNRTYRYMEKEALYPFGYGLTYSDTCVTEAEVVGEVSAESDIMLKATVKNNGTVDTDEVVQVYIKDLDSPLAVRNYSLCGFKRVSLKAGEEKSVEFTISNKAMNIVDEDGNRYIAGKHFRLFAGVSQPDTRSAELTGHKPAEIEIAL